MKDFVKYGFPITLFLFFFSIANVQASPKDWPKKIKQPYAVASGDSVYIVQQGDTYYSLSRRFKIPLDSLRSWNGTDLKIGQTLYLTHTGAAKANATPKTRLQTGSTAASAAQRSKYEPTNPNFQVSQPKMKKRVLVVPFDPHLYFSDSDDQIAYQSHIPRQNVRHAFRGRLNALLEPEGYETIHLMGGVYRNGVSELDRVYQSLHYAYQDNKQSRYNHQPVVKNEEKGGVLNWVQEQKDKLSGQQDAPVPVAKDPNKHFGVKVKDPEFYSYFNNQYEIDYYVFINQFEVSTNYENCLDLAAQNYERDFLVHYSIYDNKGELVSGNKVKIFYHSNINDVDRIVSDNMPSVAQRVLADLPSPSNN